MKTFTISEDVIIAVAELHKSYDDCNPDVGMDPGYAEFIDRAAKTLEIILWPALRDRLIKKMRVR